jgi:hypothetical protein
MLVYLNNLNKRPHKSIFKSQEAFFDLNLKGRQAAMLQDIRPQQKCIVASYKDTARGKGSVVVFENVVFQREATCQSKEDGVSYRVFFGEIVNAVEISKLAAAKDPLYAPYFNNLGHFKRLAAFSAPAPQ